MDKQVVVSVKTIIYFFLILLGIYFTYLLMSIILILIISTIIVIAMEHPIGFLTKQKFMNKPLNRSIAVLISYFLTIMVLIGILTVVVPPVVIQAEKLITSLISLTSEFPQLEESAAEESLLTILKNLDQFGDDFYRSTFSVFSSITAVFSILIISIYMSIDWINIKNRFTSLFTGNMRGEISGTLDEIEISIGAWTKGQLFLMFSVGLMSFVGLTVLQVDYALALSLIAGLLEIVPVLGPVIALILAGIVGFSQSFTKGILVIALFTLIQQIENNLLVPKVMHKVSGFAPLVILLALLIGSKLLGIIGALIAVPITMVLVILVKRFIKYSPPIN